MTVASDNEFPKVIFVEGSAPATPDAGEVKVYAKTDGLMYSKDDAGTETGPFGASTGGTITVEEVDGTPTGAIDTLVLPNGTLGIVGSTATYTPAGGGGGPTDYVSGASGTGQIIIPGLAGSPDIVPGSPSAYDQEFGSLSGNTVLGALDSNNATDAASHLHLAKTSSGTQVDGNYWTAPSTPFTMTAKVTDALLSQNYSYFGLLIAEASPGKLFTYGPIHINAPTAIETCQWTNRTTRGTYSDTTAVGLSQLLNGLYLQMIVTSGSDVTCRYSRGGRVWITSHVSVDSGLTPANFGVFLTGYGAIPLDAYFDWIRFT